MAKLIKRDEQSHLTTQVASEAGRVQQAPVPEIVDAQTQAEQLRQAATEEADKLRAEAQEKADAVKDEAQAEADQLREAAREEGRQQGLEQGLQQYAEATLAANQRSEAILAEVVPQLTSLAVRIARKILGRELEFAPELVVEIVKQALGDKARARREITLRVHPSDAQMIRESRVELVEMLSRTKDIAIREDDEVALHGVIIETEAGVIDAQLETQLDAFDKLLRHMK